MNTNKKKTELLSKYSSIEDAKKDILFHGTCEKIEGPLRGGGYDGVLWTSRSPDVSQSYIPTSGMSVQYSKPSNFSMDDYASFYYADSFDLKIARLIGYEVSDIEIDSTQKIISYMIKKDGEYASIPRQRDIYNFIKNTLGYDVDNNDDVEILMGHDENGVEEFYPADYSMPGELYIFSGAKELNLFDMSTGEGDLMDVQYHSVDKFKELATEGYDGVIIDDFAQSKTYGNVGHESVGLFPAGIKKMAAFSVPAKNYDWDTTDDLCNKHETSEFKYSELFEESRKSSLFIKGMVDEDIVSPQGGLTP